MTDTIATSATAGSLADLQREGRLLCKVGSLPVVVVWHEGKALAIEDRCPHLGFPLHQGTVEAGLLTCHWHHARFDLVSGCTLDPWADDAQGFDVESRGDDVIVHAARRGRSRRAVQQRLRDGLEQGLTLVIAKAVQGLLEASVPPAEIVRTGIEFGCTYRADGWGVGPHDARCDGERPRSARSRRPDARARARARVRQSRHTRPARPASRSSRCARTSSTSTGCRTGTGGSSRRAPRTRRSELLATAIHAGAPLSDVEGFMEAAVTDHVFIDEGHTLDFTNKAFEALGHVGDDEAAARAADRSCAQTAAAQRSEEFSEWRHPHDLLALVREAEAALPAAQAEGRAHAGECDDVAGLAWRFLDEDPEEVVGALARRVPCRSDTRTARPRARLRGVAADPALPRAERLRRLEHRPPLVHGGERAAPGARACADARADAGPRTRRAARLPRPLPERACRPAAHVGVRRPRRARRVLGSAGQRRRRGPHRVRVPAGRRQPAPARRRPRLTPSSPRTPSSTGSRSTRPRCARSPRGPTARRRPRSSSRASPASWLRTPRPGASCRPSCASPNASAAAKPSTRRPDTAALGARRSPDLVPPRNQRGCRRRGRGRCRRPGRSG